MKTLALHLLKTPYYLRILYHLHRLNYNYVFWRPCVATSIDGIDVFTSERTRRSRQMTLQNPFDGATVRHFMRNEAPPDISAMSDEELDSYVLQHMCKNKEKQLTSLIATCNENKRLISEIVLKKLFTNYSVNGKTETVDLLRKYCQNVAPKLYTHNGEFMHYLAKAQCMKGNSEKGLIILTDCYKKNESMRSYYRVIFKELIQDSVLNRSEASLVIFKKYVLLFSEKWNDHYPLVCFWNICWSSSWFSDQMLSYELLESSTVLKAIVVDKATLFSITILKQEFNEDAVTRLLQLLLKYDAMTEYVNVLQVLFSYKLNNRDLRGCAEIVRNCQTLGISLSSNQKGKYIRLLIDLPRKEQKADAKPSKNFKLKF